jgi:hypothetical protein
MALPGRNSSNNPGGAAAHIQSKKVVFTIYDYQHCGLSGLLRCINLRRQILCTSQKLLA